MPVAKANLAEDLAEDVNSDMNISEGGVAPLGHLLL